MSERVPHVNSGKGGTSTVEGFNEFRLAQWITTLLRGSPYVKSRETGDPPVTWYRIDWFRLFSDMSRNVRQAPFPPAPPVESISPPKGGISSLPKGNNDKNVGASKTPSRGRPKKEQKILHPRWKLYATMLQGAITSVRKLNKNTTTHNWSSSLYMIFKRDGVPIPRIRRAVKWYCDRLRKDGDLIRSNPNFIPICYTAQRFREKFAQVEGAVARFDEKHGRDEGLARRKKPKRAKVSKRDTASHEEDFGW